MPSARTATTATVRSSTGGICHALVISHAETPASASALPSDSTPKQDRQQQPGQARAAAVHASTRLPIASTRSPIASTGSRWPTTSTVAPPAARAVMRPQHPVLDTRRPGATSARRAAAPAPPNPAPVPGRAAAVDPATGRCRRGRARCPARQAARPARCRNRPRGRRGRDRRSGPNSSRLSRHGARHQHGALRQPGHLAPPCPQVEIGDVDAVDEYPARARRIEPEDRPAAAWSCRRRWAR